MPRGTTNSAGIKVEEYGDEYVWIAVQGVSRGKDQAEIKVSIPQARKLAIRLLQVADRQERHFETVKEYRAPREQSSAKRVSGTRKTTKARR